MTRTGSVNVCHCQENNFRYDIMLNGFSEIRNKQHKCISLLLLFGLPFYVIAMKAYIDYTAKFYFAKICYFGEDTEPPTKEGTQVLLVTLCPQIIGILIAFVKDTRTYLYVKNHVADSSLDAMNVISGRADSNQVKHNRTSGCFLNNTLT